MIEECLHLLTIGEGEGDSWCRRCGARSTLGGGWQTPDPTLRNEGQCQHESTCLLGTMDEIEAEEHSGKPPAMQAGGVEWCNVCGAMRTVLEVEREGVKTARLIWSNWTRCDESEARD